MSVAVRISPCPKVDVSNVGDIDPFDGCCCLLSFGLRMALLMFAKERLRVEVHGEAAAVVIDGVLESPPMRFRRARRDL